MTARARFRRPASLPWRPAGSRRGTFARRGGQSGALSIGVTQPRQRLVVHETGHATKSPAVWRGFVIGVPPSGERPDQHLVVMPGLPPTPLRTGSLSSTGLMCCWSRSQDSTWSQIISPVSPGMLPGSLTEAQPATL